MYDLIIIGAGPAGSSAGRLAGKLGLKTLILEKQAFPRHKPCGGALSVHAMSYLDFDLPESLQENDIYGARVHYRGHTLQKYKKRRIAVMVSRNLFDDYMLGKAIETGIEVRQEERVIDIEEYGEYVHVKTNKGYYHARFAIVAEGAHGKLKYRIRRRDKKHEYGICVATHIERPDGFNDKYGKGSIEIYFGIAKRGYGWIFPHDKYLSVGIGGLAINLPDPQKTMRSFLNSNGFNDDCKFMTHLIPAGGIKRRIVGDRTVLCGDSAGFVDSFYGEGIAYAIRSGQIATEVIAKILKGDLPHTGLNEIEKACNSEFGCNLKYSLLMSKLMHRFPGAFLKLFTQKEALIDKFLEVPYAESTYKDYLLWLIKTAPKHLLLK